jgi:hypothetical protein
MNLSHKDALLLAAYVSASYLTIDDTGARHRGQNGYTTHISNEFLPGLGARSRRAGSTFCTCCERAMRTTGSMQRPWLIGTQAQKLPHGLLERLRTHSEWLFADEVLLNAHLTRLGITQERHRRIATEGAVLHHGFTKDLPIVSDDAEQFKVLCHGLCWVHAERLIHTLFPSIRHTGKNSPRCAVSSGSCMPT